MTELTKRVDDIRAKIKSAMSAAGRTDCVRIVPATKTVSPEIISQLSACGIEEVGENRVQELLEKYDKVSGIKWHFIGALQTNKVKYIVDKVVLIHSVDRQALADEIERQCAKRGIKMDVLVEINVGGEESKSGVSPDEAENLMDYIAKKHHLNLRGVMSVLPKDAPDDNYKRLYELFTIAKNRFGADILSAGMSKDYEKAIAFGANLIRPGTAIFGERNYGRGV